MGRSNSWGREESSTPIRKGVGEQQMSSMLAGSTGTNVCCQVKGYNRARAAWAQCERVLEGGGGGERAITTQNKAYPGYRLQNLLLDVRFIPGKKKIVHTIGKIEGRP